MAKKKRIRSLLNSNGVLCELRAVYRENRRGELCNDDAKSLMNILKIMNGIIETSDLETRIEALELQDASKKHY